MANLFDYLTWRGDVLLSQAPLNDVDALLLCRLSYFALDGIVPPDASAAPVPLAEAAAQYARNQAQETQTPALHKDDARLFAALSASPRFSATGLASFVNQIVPEDQKQFCAVTVHLDADTAFVAFRGTDNTIAGWNEDFNMGYMTPVPSQREAADYLAHAGARKAMLHVGGHSKGGNLAVYAATFCPQQVQTRIVNVFSMDGPGFTTGVLASPQYLAVRERVHSFVPQSSVVGMLLDHEEEYTIVHSGQMGLMQHDLYSWEVLGPRFVTLENVTASSQLVNHTLKDWIAGMDNEQRAQFTNELFQILTSANVERLSALKKDWPRHMMDMLGSLRNVDEPTRQLLGKTLSALFSSAMHNILPGDKSLHS